MARVKRMKYDKEDKLNFNINVILNYIFERELCYDPRNTILKYIDKYPRIVYQSLLPIPSIAYFFDLFDITKKLLLNNMSPESDDKLYKSVLYQVIANEDTKMFDFLIENNIKIVINTKDIPSLFIQSS